VNKERPSQSGSGSIGDHSSGNVINTGYVEGNVVGRDKITNVYEAPAPTVSALHQLPPPPADFTGCEAEIAELLVALEDASLTISGVQGMGGVGKTTLALKLAEKIKERYPDGQFYLDLMGISPQPLTPAKAMEHVIRSYHPDAKLPESEADLRGIYLSVLHDQRALLLMDNARDRRQVEPLIPPTNCRLLVTSRQNFTLPGIFAKSLDCLPLEDVCKLLLTIAPGIGDLAGDIARLCGNLPFALRLAAGVIAERRNIQPADYVRQLAYARKRLELIEASLSTSYDILSEEQQQRWRMLAVFPDSFGDAAAAAVWVVEDEKARDALGELMAFSLVEWNEATRRYRLHDLARVFAGSRLSDAESDGGRRLHARHYQEVLSAASALYLRGGDMILRGLALYDLEFVNIEAGHAWATEQAGSDDTAVKLCITYPHSGTHVLDLRQHPHERIRWLEAMLAAARKLNRREAEGVALGNLGIACAELGETSRAIEFLEQYLTITRETGDRRGEGTALGNLGIAYKNLGESHRAIELLDRALVIARETGDRRSEGSALGNLGTVYTELGETSHAIGYLEQALVIAREIGDRLSEGNTLGNLGAAYAELGEASRAIELLEQALVISREIGDRRGEGTALNNLGIACAKMGETSRAIEYLEQHLTIARETGDRRGEGNCLGSMGIAYKNLGESRRAIECYEQHMAVARETGDRRSEGTSLWNIALSLDKLEDRAQAITRAEASLVIFEELELRHHTERVRSQIAEWKAGDTADQI
jgi:tetratricopeptide (TPR) repeat protein